MRIDNSAAKTFFDCPMKYLERYENNLELADRNSEGLDFGTRWHDLQANRMHPNGPLSGQPLPDARLEAECLATFAAYLQHYGPETLDVVEVERTLEVPLNDRHTLAFKMDLIYRNSTGGLVIRDYKTEKRGGQFNTPESWAARSQVALYQWAAERHFGEAIDTLELDVTTRQSGKGQEGPSFLRQNLIRTRAQQAAAVANIIWVADQIETMQQTGFWPANTEHCRDGWKRCDYFALHVIGRTDGNLRLYQPAKAYLDL
jgi:hypothetical protein